MSIRNDVDRALEIMPKIAELQAELKNIETRLIMAGYTAGAAGEHEELKDAEREGRRWFARGTARMVPLIFTADAIRGQFIKDSPAHSAIRVSLGSAHGSLVEFFKPKTVYLNTMPDGKKFRARADEILGVNAPAFITACIARDKDGVPKSDVKIDWDHAEAVAGAK